MSTYYSAAHKAVRGLAGFAAFAGLALAVAVAPLQAQEAEADAPKFPADPADVESIDAIMAAVYDVISGPAGELRDWDRMRSLFVEGARLMPTGQNPAGKRGMRVFTVEDYIEQAGPWLEENGFFESEIGRVTEQFGNVVHLMSAYDSRHTAEDAEPFVRGVNSFQLWNDGERWWVVSVLWEDERSGGEIPKRYLGTHDHSTGVDHSMHGMDADKSAEGADKEAQEDGEGHGDHD